MRLENRSNNAYDTIILIDPSTGLAISRWDATPENVDNFLDSAQDVDSWDNHHNEDNPEDFGELLGWREGTNPVTLAPSMAGAAESLLARMQSDLN